MEELREKMINSIEKNGREALETVAISQELDEFIVVEMREMLRGYKCGEKSRQGIYATTK